MPITTYPSHCLKMSTSNLALMRSQKQPPRTELEVIQRIDEINGLVGYFESEQVFYCTFTDVDPQLTTKVHRDVIDQYMNPDRKESLLSNFTQLAAQTVEMADEDRANPRGRRM